MESLKTLLTNIAELFKLKSVVTISLTACAMYLTVTDKMQTEAFIGIYASVITYYFTKKESH